VNAFDCVDDESIKEPLIQKKADTIPKNATLSYSFYCFTIWSYLQKINEIRRGNSLNQFQFRPHCGESGELHHLLTSFLISDGIAHGTQLYQMPLVNYLYYLTEIPIFCSPISNNCLFYKFVDNPFPHYFKQGLHVSLNTDDPMQFHFTNEPLVEEYGTARQNWDLSDVDLCEIALNSLKFSSLSDEEKNVYLFDSEQTVSNVPKMRIQFREGQLSKHLKANKL